MARYRAYKGRGHRGIAVLVVFVILLVLAAAAVFILPDYIVYTDDGVRLEVPIFGWVRSTSPSGPGLEPSPVASVDIIVETPTPSPTPDPSPTPTPTPKPRLLGVPLSLLASDDKLIDLKDFAIAAGVNGLLLEIKDAEGEIAEPERLKEIAALLRDSGLELIAGISAFRDNRITRSNEGKTYGVKHSSGVNWLDNNGNRWINPYVPEARRFVIDRVLAARDAGFDGVLLDDVCFPHYGALSKINYGADATVSHIAAMGDRKSVV